MGKCYLVTELVYRATKDGFTAYVFHAKSNDQGPTITLIKSKTNQIFGAYNPTAWNNSGSYSTDKSAFLFHVTKKNKLEQFRYHENAVYNNASYGPTFGGNHDLHICDSANTVNGSYCNVGYTYKAPPGIENGTTEGMNYFAGSYNFMIDEIEVYKIIVQE
jgi:hypothetical protein